MQRTGNHTAVDQLLSGEIDKRVLADGGSSLEYLTSFSFGRLLKALCEAGSRPVAVRLADRISGHPLGAAALLGSAEEVVKACGQQEARKLTLRAAEQVRPERDYETWILVRALLEVGAAGAVSSLLERDHLSQIKVDDYSLVASLLDVLQRAEPAARRPAWPPRPRRELLSTITMPSACSCGICPLRGRGQARRATSPGG